MFFVRKVTHERDLMKRANAKDSTLFIKHMDCCYLLLDYERSGEHSGQGLKEQ